MNGNHAAACQAGALPAIHPPALSLYALSFPFRSSLFSGPLITCPAACFTYDAIAQNVQGKS